MLLFSTGAFLGTTMIVIGFRFTGEGLVWGFLSDIGIDVRGHDCRGFELEIV